MHDHKMIRSAVVRLLRMTELLRQSRILLVAAALGTVFWATLFLRPALFAPLATWSENRFAALNGDLSRYAEARMGDARFGDARYVDSRYADARYADARYGDSRHADGRLQTPRGGAEVAVDLHAPEPAKHLALRKLTAEQESIAQFLSQRYRVAIDSSQEFVDLAYRTAKDMKMDPWLLLAVMSVESSLNPQAMSNRGAQGLMQVLTRVHADKFAPFGGVSAAFDPLVNIRVGARILREYIERDGSIEGALKSYVGAAFHADDRGYGGKVLTERERLAAVAAGRPFNEVRAVAVASNRPAVVTPLSAAALEVISGSATVARSNDAPLSVTLDNSSVDGTTHVDSQSAGAKSTVASVPATLNSTALLPAAAIERNND